MNIGVVLLAAGSAQRFGSDKRLANVNNRSMLTVSAEIYLSQNLPLIVVIENGVSPELLGSIPQDAITVAIDRMGMGESLAAGVSAAMSEDWDACFIALADMPYIKKDTIAKLLGSARPDTIVVPSYEKQRGQSGAFLVGAILLSLLKLLAIKALNTFWLMQ